MELSKVCTQDQYARALESWAWLDLSNKTPLMSSLFGDVFLADDAGIWLLSRFDGTLELHRPNRDALLDDLATEDGMDTYLLGGLALAIEAAGTPLKPNEIYDFMPPPALGGSFEVSNAEAADMVVALTIAGQMAHQTKDLPEGTPVTRISIDGEPPTREAKGRGLLARLSRRQG